MNIKAAVAMNRRVKAYGTSEGVTKGWDTRGRKAMDDHGWKLHHSEAGKQVFTKDHPDWKGFEVHLKPNNAKVIADARGFNRSTLVDVPHEDLHEQLNVLEHQLAHKKSMLAYGTSEGNKKEWDTRGRGRAKLSREEIGTLQEHMVEAIKDDNHDWANALTHAIAQQHTDKNQLSPQDRAAGMEWFRQKMGEGEYKAADTIWKAFTGKDSHVGDAAKKSKIGDDPMKSLKSAGQTDSSSFVGRKYRVLDSKYGHPIGEYDNPEEAKHAMLARPYSKVISEPIPSQTPQVRDIARQRAVQTNPDIDGKAGTRVQSKRRK